MKKLEVKNLTSPRSGCAVANQFIIFDYTNGIITFQSYTSCIAEYNMNTEELVLYPKYNYSRTKKINIYTAGNFGCIIQCVDSKGFRWNELY